MSFTCKNCGKPLTPGNRFCSQCGLAFDQPVPPTQATPGQATPGQVAPVTPAYPPVTPSLPGSPSPAKKVNPAWIAGIVLFVAFIGIMGLMSAGRGTQTPAPSPPRLGAAPTSPPVTPFTFPVSSVSTAGNLVGSWATDATFGGASQHWVYTFKGDGTMLEATTSQAGQGGGSESYTSTGDQVTISDGKAYTEQGTITWAGPDQFRYKITSNTADANQVGLETVFTRQSSTATTAASTPATPAPSGATSTAPITPSNNTTLSSSITADDLYLEFKKDPAGAQAKYSDLEDKRQAVRITGVIDHIIVELLRGSQDGPFWCKLLP